MILKDMAAAAVALAVFGFLAAMAWMGGLVGIDSTKVRILAWIVEDIGVGALGRTGATLLFAGMGLLSVPAVLWVRARWF